MWTTIRVFISSTFRDMQAERDHLVRVVFPRLREELEPYRVHLVDIDLRWGVTREQAEQDGAVELCLRQIDECRPYFLAVLGERYGWVSSRIPQAFVEALGIDPSGDLSITELEILHGALATRSLPMRCFFYFRDSGSLEGAPREVFAEPDPEAARKLALLKSRIRASGFPLLDGYRGRWDPNAIDPHTRKPGRLVDLDGFGQDVHDRLLSAILDELGNRPGPESRPGAEHERDEEDVEEREAQERFMESRLRVFVGREEPLRKLEDFLRGGDRVPAVVIGNPGSGKSAVLASFVEACRLRARGVLVLSHFAGAGAQSSRVDAALHRLLRELARGVLDSCRRQKLEKLSPDSFERLAIEREFRIPDIGDPGMAHAFARHLELVPADRPVILVLDGLDQLAGENALSWIPSRLPGQIKLVVSAAAGSTTAAGLLDRPHVRVAIEPLGDDERRAILKEVPSLSAKALDSREVDYLLRNPNTANALFLRVALEELRGFGSFELLKQRIRSLPGGAPSGRIARLFQRMGLRPKTAAPPDPAILLFDQILDRLEGELGTPLVREAMASLAVARRGLSERELATLVSREEDLFVMLRQLRPFLLQRGPLLDFFHGSLRTAVERRYLQSTQVRRAAHARLANLFAREPLDGRKADELVWQLLRSGNPEEAARRLECLAYLETRAASGSFADLGCEFREAIREQPSAEPVLGLLDEAIRAHRSFLERHPECLFQCLWNAGWWVGAPEAAAHCDPAPQGPQVLKPLLEEWRRRKEGTPGFLWLRSLRPPVHPLGTGSRLIPVEPSAHALAFSADGRRLGIAAGYAILVVDVINGEEVLSFTLDPNRDLVGFPDETPGSLAWSPEGNRLAVVLGNRLLIFDSRSGRQLFATSCPDAGTHQAGLAGYSAPVAFSPDGRLVLVRWNGGSTWLVDAVDGRPVRPLLAPDGPHRLGFYPDGKPYTVGSVGDEGDDWQPGVRLFELASGRELSRQPGFLEFTAAPASRCLVGANARYQGQIDLGVYDLLSAKTLATHQLEGELSGYSASPDGRFVAAPAGPENRWVRVWHTLSGRLVGEHRIHDGPVTGTAFSPDGAWLASASRDGTVRLRRNGHAPSHPELFPRRRNREPAGYRAGIEFPVFSPDGAQVVTAGDEGDVWIWDTQTGRAAIRVTVGSGDWVEAMAFSPGGGSLALAHGESVHVVEAQTGRPELDLPGNGRVTALRWSPDGTQLATGRARADGGWLEILDLPSGRPRLARRIHEREILALTWSPDGSRIASGAEYEDPAPIQILDASTGECLLAIPPMAGSFMEGGRLAFSPDGTRLAALTFFGNKVATFRTADGSLIEELDALMDPAAGLESPPIGLGVLRRMDSSDTAVFDWNSGQVRGWYPVRAQAVATDPSGRLIALAAGAHLHLVAIESSG